MDVPKVVLFALVTIIIVVSLLYKFVFKKSEEPEPEEELEELEKLQELEEELESSPDTIDDAMTGGDDEPVPDEDETSLETGPADDEVEEDDTVEGYMLKK